MIEAFLKHVLLVCGVIPRYIQERYLRSGLYSIRNDDDDDDVVGQL